MQRSDVKSNLMWNKKLLYLVSTKDGIFRVSEWGPSRVDHGSRSCHNTVISARDGGVCCRGFKDVSHDAGAYQHLAEAQSAVSSSVNRTGSHVAPSVLVGLR